MFPAEKMISKDSKANDSSCFRGYLSLQCHAGNHYSPVTFHCHYSPSLFMTLFTPNFCLFKGGCPLSLKQVLIKFSSRLLS